MRPLHEKPIILRYCFADLTACWFQSMFMLSTAIVASETSKPSPAQPGTPGFYTQTQGCEQCHRSRNTSPKALSR